VHGFATNKEVNWEHPGWATPIDARSRSTIAVTAAQPSEPALYYTDLMAYAA
jgi:hypothetical protein